MAAPRAPPRGPLIGLTLKPTSAHLPSDPPHPPARTRAVRVPSAARAFTELLLPDHFSAQMVGVRVDNLVFEALVESHAYLRRAGAALPRPYTTGARRAAPTRAPARAPKRPRRLLVARHRTPRAAPQMLRASDFDITTAPTQWFLLGFLTALPAETVARPDLLFVRGRPSSSRPASRRCGRSPTRSCAPRAWRVYSPLPPHEPTLDADLFVRRTVRN